MNFDFSSGRITMIVAPVDMRASYRRLALIAEQLFGIDVDAGKDFVVFISRQRQLVKMIWRDEHGSSVLIRRLNSGRFEQFLVKHDEKTKPFTQDDLMSFLDGKPLFTSLSY